MLIEVNVVILCFQGVLVLVYDTCVSVIRVQPSIDAERNNVVVFYLQIQYIKVLVKKLFTSKNEL